MAARERQRDKQHAITTKLLSWPTIVLAGGVGLSLAANLAQAQRDTWGRIMAAVPPGAFLVAVSMIERRAARHARPAADAQSQDDEARAPSEPGRLASPPSDSPDEALLGQARRAAADHRAAHGQPITRDALRARLGISNQAASDLLRQLRASQDNDLPAPSRAA